MSEKFSPVNVAKKISNTVVGSVNKTVGFAKNTATGAKDVLLTSANKLTTGILGKGGKKKATKPKKAALKKK